MASNKIRRAYASLRMTKGPLQCFMRGLYCSNCVIRDSCAVLADLEIDKVLA